MSLLHSTCQKESLEEKSFSSRSLFFQHFRSLGWSCLRFQKLKSLQLRQNCILRVRGKRMRNFSWNFLTFQVFWTWSGMFSDFWQKTFDRVVDTASTNSFFQTSFYFHYLFWDFEQKHLDLPEKILAGLLTLHSTFPEEHSQQKWFFGAFFDFFIRFGPKEKFHGHWVVNFCSDWRKCFSRDENFAFYMSTKSFCEKNRSVNFLLFSIIFGLWAKIV